MDTIEEPLTAPETPEVYLDNDPVLLDFWKNDSIITPLEGFES